MNIALKYRTRAQEVHLNVMPRLSSHTSAIGSAVDLYLARAASSRKLRRILVALFVIAPTLVAALYYGLWAQPRYVSHADFVVRGMQPARAGGLDALLRTFGVARAGDDANIVESYMLSRDAVTAVDKLVPLRKVFSRAEGDMFARFPSFWESDTFEGLYSHYKRRVTVRQNRTRGITQFSVETFRPEDSRRVAVALLAVAEQMVNAMNKRAHDDAVGAAERVVREAEQQVIATQAALLKFRDAAALVDPSKSSSATLDTMTTLTLDLARIQAQIAQKRQQTGASPVLEPMVAHERALRARIEEERRTLAGTPGALAPKVGHYERLTLTRGIAEKSLAAATTSLETAREEARRQQIYIEQLVTPNLSDYAEEPQRLRMIFTVALVCAMGYAVFWILSVGAREHAQ